MWFWLVTLVVILLLLAWKGSGKPVYYHGLDLDEVAPYLDYLKRVMIDGSLLYIQHEGSERFVQFAKYIEDTGRTNLYFGFPDAPWSRRYFDGVVQGLRESGWRYEVRETDDDPVRRFVTIAYIASAENALDILRQTCRAMGLSAEETYRVHFQGAAHPKLAMKRLKQQVETARKRNKSDTLSG